MSISDKKCTKQAQNKLGKHGRRSSGAQALHQETRHTKEARLFRTLTTTNPTHQFVLLWMLPRSFTDLITMASSEWLSQEMEHAQTKEQKYPELDKEHIMGIDTHTTCLSGLRAHAKAPTEQS